MITLGIDCGTQSTKTIALDSGGKILAQASRVYDVIAGLPQGHMEQDPRTWVEAMESTVKEVAAQLGARKSEVKAIGVSGQQHGFVALDAKGEVIRPAKLWCDTSTEPECEAIRTQLGGRARLMELVGNDMLPGFTAPKILWLKKHEPKNFARLAKALLPHDYLNFYLTGDYWMEYGDASGTALLDVRKRQWCGPVLECIDTALQEKLPPVESSRRKPARLKPQLAKEWGLGADVLVSAGGGDNMMAAIGTGNVRAGRITASLGTSGTIFAYAQKPVVDPMGEIAAFCDSTDAWLPLVCTMNVTVATEAMRKFMDWGHPEFEAAVEKTPAGADGLVFLPYLQGERTPSLPRGCGVLYGINTANFSPAHFARATMEGVTLGLQYGLRRLRELGVTPSQIRLTGGGSKSAVWGQLCADIFGCPVTRMQSAEGAALGAAIQALAAADGSRSVADWADAIATVDKTGSFEPRRSGFDYAALAEKQTALTRALVEKKFL